MSGLVLAHGLSGRADLPIPQWLFTWMAAGILVVSFISLARLWRRPRLENYEVRPLPRAISRVLTSTATDVACGAFGVFLLGVVIWAGFTGVQTAVENIVPTFVYVIFWVGLVFASVLFGDVFRAFNPWRAIGRAASWAAGRVGGERLLSAPPPYPDGLGRWPAAAGLVAFVWLELASPSGVEPKTLAAATLVYSALTFLGMGLFGVETWSSRAEAFSVYFGLFAKLSVFERRGEEVVLRPPIVGLTTLEPLAGTVALLATMIGTVTFDGFQETNAWSEVGPRIADWLTSIGLGPALADELTAGLGIFMGITVIGGFYVLAIKGARTVGGGNGLALAFVHSLVPIAVVYVASHYLTFLLFQGQAMGYLLSNPLGEGWDLFGTAHWTIDYALIGATVTWYVQVAFVVAGHLSGLALAHDRALVLYRDAEAATRSQAFALIVMVGFTSLALWLLSQANA
jgi:hypothetical protein